MSDCANAIVNDDGRNADGCASENASARRCESANGADLRDDYDDLWSASDCVNVNVNAIGHDVAICGTNAGDGIVSCTRFRLCPSRFLELVCELVASRCNPPEAHGHATLCHAERENETETVKQSLGVFNTLSVTRNLQFWSWLTQSRPD